MIIPSPPEGSAGKNFRTSSPSSNAVSISVGVTTPGTGWTPCSWQCCTTFGFVPGLTINLAPAFIARSACSVVSTVPAPTSTSGHSWAMRLMASSPAAVRKVISAAGIPPAARALARGTAWAASSKAITGRIPILWISSNILFMVSASLLRLPAYYSNHQNA